MVVSDSCVLPMTTHPSLPPPPQADAVSVVVGSPTTYGTGLAKHTRYNVQTKTTLTQFPKKEMSVWRRYSDFEWLHKR